MMEMQQTAEGRPAPSQTAVKAGMLASIRGTLGDTRARFHGDGVRYKAKLIGMDPVPDAQGEKMCWDSMMKLKGLEEAARRQGKRKLRIWLKISPSGLKIVDERSGIVLQNHEKSRISSLTKDKSDPRALAYIYQHEDSYILFYIKMANQADPVLLDINEVCQTANQETSQESAEMQSISLVPLSESSASAAEGSKPDLSSGQSNQPSSTNELMEVFSKQLEEPLSPIQSPTSTTQPEPPPEMLSPAPMFSTAQILSMFPTQPPGGSPYSSPVCSPTSMPWALQGLQGHQWAGHYPATPGRLPAGAPPGVTASPAGGQPQSQGAVSPQPGFTMEGSTAGGAVTTPGATAALASPAVDSLL